ncbi:hypothetical protein PENTCL1PPCAC_7802, partial [Pristionchus entomophagus]
DNVVSRNPRRRIDLLRRRTAAHREHDTRRDGIHAIFRCHLHRDAPQHLRPHADVQTGQEVLGRLQQRRGRLSLHHGGLRSDLSLHYRHPYGVVGAATRISRHDWTERTQRRMQDRCILTARVHLIIDLELADHVGATVPLGLPPTRIHS